MQKKCGKFCTQTHPWCELDRNLQLDVVIVAKLLCLYVWGLFSKLGIHRENKIQINIMGLRNPREDAGRLGNDSIKFY